MSRKLHPQPLLDSPSLLSAFASASPPIHAMHAKTVWAALLSAERNLFDPEQQERRQARSASRTASRAASRKTSRRGSEASDDGRRIAAAAAAAAAGSLGALSPAPVRIEEEKEEEEEDENDDPMPESKEHDEKEAHDDDVENPFAFAISAPCAINEEDAKSETSESSNACGIGSGMIVGEGKLLMRNRVPSFSNFRPPPTAPSPDELLDPDHPLYARSAQLTPAALSAMGLPLRAHTLLSSSFAFLTSRLVRYQTSADRSTTKLLIRLQDGQHIESVIMRHKVKLGGGGEESMVMPQSQNDSLSVEGPIASVEQRITLCVSSQVGCAMQCVANGTLVVRSDGRRVAVEELKAEDCIVGQDGVAVHVEKVAQGSSSTMYRIRTNQGSYSCIPNHLCTAMCNTNPTFTFREAGTSSHMLQYRLLQVQWVERGLGALRTATWPTLQPGQPSPVSSGNAPSNLLIGTDEELKARVLAWLEEGKVHSHPGSVAAQYGEWIDTTAEFLFHNEHLLGNMSPHLMHATTPLPPPPGIHQVPKLRGRSRSTTIVGVDKLEANPGRGYGYTAVQVTAGRQGWDGNHRFALANGLLTHNCTFCATGTMGLRSNLTQGEIVEQLVIANRFAPIRNIVFMGMGEPLHNYEAVLGSIECMSDPLRFNLAPSRITVSTVGIVPRMLDLTRDLPSVQLALSLHAPTQELRQKIVPTAKTYHLDKLMDAADYFISRGAQKSGGSKAKQRRILIEYVLLCDSEGKSVNCGEKEAHELGALLRDKQVLINLIPYNTTDVAANYRTPPREMSLAFQRILQQEYNLFTTVRVEMGADIDGACGQLALSNQDVEVKPKRGAKNRAALIKPRGLMDDTATPSDELMHAGDSSAAPGCNSSPTDIEDMGMNGPACARPPTAAIRKRVQKNVAQDGSAVPNESIRSEETSAAVTPQAMLRNDHMEAKEMASTGQPTPPTQFYLVRFIAAFILLLLALLYLRDSP